MERTLKNLEEKPAIKKRLMLRIMVDGNFF